MERIDCEGQIATAMTLARLLGIIEEREEEREERKGKGKERERKGKGKKIKIEKR